MARPYWTYYTFDLDLIFKVKTGDLNFEVWPIFTLVNREYSNYAWNTFGQYVLGATKFSHSDL